jgi:hypothetical protein
MMITITRVFALAAMLVSVTGTFWAANTTQVGVWSGTAKVVTFTAGTNKNVSKQPIHLEIAADNSTTITLNGALVAAGSATFNETDVFIVMAPPNSAFFATFNFKNTTMKGAAIGINIGGGVLVSTTEIKYKLKKQ